MREHDDLLQQSLDAIERGEPLEAVISRLPKEASSLEALIRLAATVRNLDHPVPSGEVVLSFERKTRPVSRPAKNGHDPERKPLGWRLPVFGLSLKPAWAGAALAFVLVAATLAVLFVGGVPGRALAATLTGVSGDVQAASGDMAWQAVSEGDRIKAGTRLKTAPGAQATLLYSDGSQTRVGPEAEVFLTRLSGGWGNSIQIVLDQERGQTENQVIPLQGIGSEFRVLTDAGEVNVQGTAFDVLVAEGGFTRFAVDHGDVQITAGGGSVHLGSGQVLAAAPGEALPEPSYQFSLRGVLGSNLGNIWFVSGVPFTIIPETIIKDVSTDQPVQVNGRILANGEWVADQIIPGSDDTPLSNFTGIVEAKTGGLLQVGGWTLVDRSGSQAGDAVQVGEVVRVDFIVREEGIWQAVDLARLNQTNEDENPADLEAELAAENPELEFRPDDIGVTACSVGESQPNSFTASLLNSSEDSQAVASQVSLGYQITRGAEYVSEVRLSPAGWEQILPGEQATITAEIILRSDAWAQAADETEVKVRVFIAGVANSDKDYHARLTLTVQKGCETQPTATPGVTEPAPTDTAEATATPQPTPTATPEIDLGGETLCTGAQPHPTGTTLAGKYGVPYEEIMGWFCQGYGFGEIDLAYEISRAVPLPVDQVFSMRAGGAGWGEIKQQLLPDQQNGNAAENNHSKSNGKDKTPPGQVGKPEKTKKPKR